ncbi:glycosyltransferase [Luteibacter yeojuensis]|uniref:glycosyltransferase n=1 Tax=Luteibacter yeojuensis TaxID=345309 RepID=UPI000AB2FE74|nr:glycosyltransferase [Luteibacter yeojuensis]
MLVIETMTPDPSRDSGSVRLCQIFSLLNRAGWQIDFMAEDNDATPDDAARLGALGVRIVHQPALSWLRGEGETLDAIMLCRLPVATQYIDVVRKTAPRARIVFDTVDLHFIRERRAAEVTGNPALIRQAERSRERELDMVVRCDVTLVVSQEERDVLAREAPEAKVEVVSNIHAVRGRQRGFEGRSGMLFVGGFGHPPNEDAVRWFIADVLPLVRAVLPGATLHVVGDIDATSRRSIERDGVRVHGRVGDLAELHNEALVSIAPLRFGAGVKGKVNQAMSFGLPVILTTIAAEGMHLRHGVDALIVDTPEDMAAAIIRLAHDETTWNALSEAGMENVRVYFSMENAGRNLRLALDQSP